MSRNRCSSNSSRLRPPPSGLLSRSPTACTWCLCGRGISGKYERPRRPREGSSHAAASALLLPRPLLLLLLLLRLRAPPRRLPYSSASLSTRRASSRAKTTLRWRRRRARAAGDVERAGDAERGRRVADRERRRPPAFRPLAGERLLLRRPGDRPVRESSMCCTSTCSSKPVSTRTCACRFVSPARLRISSGAGERDEDGTPEPAGVFCRRRDGGEPWYRQRSRSLRSMTPVR